MKLKHRFKRFKYTLSWKYPRFYALCYVLAFPLQLAALGVVIFSTISFLLNSNKHEGFVTASTQQTQSKKADASLKNIPTITKVSESTADSESAVAEADVSNADGASNPDTDDSLTEVKLSGKKPRLKRRPTETELDVTPISDSQSSVLQLEEKELTVASVSTTKLSVTPTKKTQPNDIKSVKPTSKQKGIPVAKPVASLTSDPTGVSVAVPVIPKDSEGPKVLSTNTKSDNKPTATEATSLSFNQGSQSADQTPEFKTSGLYNQNWINVQQSGMFVIQLVASTKYSALVDYGRSLTSLESVTIYPYRKNENGRTVYGISTGLYRSAREAVANIETFPVLIKEGKPWVRKIEELKTLISDLE